MIEKQIRLINIRKICSYTSALEFHNKLEAYFTRFSKSDEGPLRFDCFETLSQRTKILYKETLLNMGVLQFSTTQYIYGNPDTDNTLYGGEIIGYTKINYFHQEKKDIEKIIISLPDDYDLLNTKAIIEQIDEKKSIFIPRITHTPDSGTTNLISLDLILSLSKEEKKYLLGD